ncbi:MAG: histidinol-phosphate transaminase [Actinobacteria bacterium]|nr:histidinol-phosphate transaminase [Actinomycetota bacterium]
MQATAAVEQLKPYVAGPRLRDVCSDHGVADMAFLHANECPDGPFPEVVAAVAEALPRLNRYPDQDCSALRAILVDTLGVTPNQLMFGNGSCELLKLLAEAYVSPGEHVVFPSPSFVVYRHLGMQRQAVLKPVPLKEYGIDLQAMVAVVDAQTRMVVVCNPNNPTGSYVSTSALKLFVSGLPSTTLVVLDEAYVEYVTEPAHEDTTSWVVEFPNLVVLRTFSKIYGLAGLRVGYGVANADIVQAIDRLRQPYNVSALAQVAATEALRHPGQVAARRDHVARERERMATALERMGREYVPSQANFLFLNVEGLPMPGEEVPRLLLARGVMTRSGYFMDCPGWVRVSIGTVAENDRFLAALAALTD